MILLSTQRITLRLVAFVLIAGTLLVSCGRKDEPPSPAQQIAPQPYASPADDAAGRYRFRAGRGNAAALGQLLRAG